MVTVATRDLADTRERLERWLTERFPPGSAPVVSELVAPDANGVSTETLLFGVRWSSDGEVQSSAMVARVAPDPANMPIFPVYDIEGQFRTVKTIGELGVVPVPTVHWCEPDPAVLGSPFFVMDRVEGVVPPDVMPYNMGSWVTEASPEERARMQESSVAALARIHGIDRPAERFAHVGGGSLRQLVDHEREYYEWMVSDGNRSKLFEEMFDWLEAHWPDDDGPIVLSWGDARIGNVIYRDFEPVAVLDWEMAALAPRETDVGWFIFLHEMFEDIAARYGLGGLPDFLRADDVIAAYERQTGYTPQNMRWFRMLAGLRASLPISRAARRSVHFGESDMPDEFDGLIHHKGLLERMLAG